MDKKKVVCCFCGIEITDYGNDPWPSHPSEDAVCCDPCNWDIVLPRRLAMIYGEPDDEQD